MKKLIIEARINEYEPRNCNRNRPWTPKEIALDATECRDAGASIVHFHARKIDGSPELSISAYGEIIRRIRNNSDILVHPTLGTIFNDLPLTERLKPMLELAAEPATRPDLLPLCLGTLNWDFFDIDKRRFFSTDKIFLNSTEDLVLSAQALKRAGIGMSCESLDIGATRRLAAFLDAGIIPSPAYLAFHLASGGMLSGHPGTPDGLNAHLAFLPQEHVVEWGVLNHHGTIFPLVEKIVREGGHIHIGIGDYHYRELGAPTNHALVRQGVELATHFGREIATPDETRDMLGLTFECPKRTQPETLSRISAC